MAFETTCHLARVFIFTWALKFFFSNKSMEQHKLNLLHSVEQKRFILLKRNYATSKKCAATFSQTQKVETKFFIIKLNQSYLYKFEKK